MQYAKVNNNTLLEYPYTMVDLHKENPSSSYDNRFSLPEWYSQTEKAVNTGNKIVEVFVEDAPEIDYIHKELFHEIIV